MPTPTSTRPIEPLLQRVDRIRRSHNLRELQRACYMLVATGLTAASILLVAALFGSTRAFAVTLWSTTAAVAVTGALLLAEAGRRWLGRERAVAWIETRTALHGRLRSLVELDGRAESAATRFFLPVLRDENSRALPLWEPRRLVPRRVPRAALGTALASVAALLIALTLTPVLYPRVPELANTAASGVEPEASFATGTPRALPDDTGADADDSTLARLPARAQERIRHAVWGDAWERARAALARAAERGRRARDGDGADDGGAPDGGEETWQLAERPPTGNAPAADAGKAHPRRGTDGSADEAPARGGTVERTSDEGAAPSHAGAGAGTGTTRALYGTSTLPADLASRTHFELGLVTRMRLERRGGTGDNAPPPADDVRPRLVPSDRREELAHAMPVPRAYEPIVRQVFAHRAAEVIE
jgi:hypothetical protein